LWPLGANGQYGWKVDIAESGRSNVDCSIDPALR